MNYDTKNCAIAPDTSKCEKVPVEGVPAETILDNLRYLTECLHSIESKIIGISNTMLFEEAKARQYTEPKDMNTEIIHDKEVALAILDTLCCLASRIGIDQ